jgi:hypothetical protein
MIKSWYNLSLPPWVKQKHEIVAVLSSIEMYLSSKAIFFAILKCFLDGKHVHTICLGSNNDHIQEKCIFSKLFYVFSQ